MSKTMSIYAEALIANRNFKNAKVDGTAVGIMNARNWSALVKACRIPAYAIRKYRYDNMGEVNTVAPCDQSALYDAIRPVINLIGEVNGDMLNAHNIAEEFIANSVRFRTIDITPEMAHARCDMREARKTMNEDETEETIANYNTAKAEVERLEAMPNNCKRIVEIQSEAAFVKAIEIALGDAITKQALRSVEDILAEKAAKKAERDAKRKANKIAKKNAK